MRSGAGISIVSRLPHRRCEIETARFIYDDLIGADGCVRSPACRPGAWEAGHIDHLDAIDTHKYYIFFVDI